MTKKIKSTVDKFIASLSPREYKKFNEEYKKLLLSELNLATQANDIKAMKQLTKMIEMIPSHEKKNI